MKEREHTRDKWKGMVGTGKEHGSVQRKMLRQQKSSAEVTDEASGAAQMRRNLSFSASI